MLFAVYLFLLWAVCASMYVIRVHTAGMLYVAPRWALLGLVAAVVTVAAVRFLARAWGSEEALVTAVIVSTGAAVAVFGLLYVLTVRHSPPARVAGPSQRTWRSSGCHSRVSGTDLATWACATVTFDPWQVDSGGTMVATYSFEAKRDMRYVKICFPGLGLDCAFSHKYPLIKRGAVIKRTLHLVVGDASTTTSDQSVANETTFYKTSPEVMPALRAWKSPYVNPYGPKTKIGRFLHVWWWGTGAHMCVVVSDSNASCAWSGF